MVSFEITGDFQAAKRVVQATRLFQLAVSLGAVESLIEQPASMSHASYDRHDRLAHGITDGLIRLSVGLEAFEDLRDDLDLALSRASRALLSSPCPSRLVRRTAVDTPDTPSFGVFSVNLGRLCRY